MTSGQSIILMYHSIDDSGSVLSVSPRMFREQMHALKQSGMPVVPLSAVRERPGSVAITFDDAFHNFRDQALPVLTDCTFPSTVFAVSDYCGRVNNWPSQPQNAIPRLSLMSWSDLADIAKAGVDIGAHTATHPRLTDLPRHEITSEIVRSKQSLEDRLGKGVETFAYPYGMSSPDVRSITRSYFRIACGVRLQPVSPTSDRINLPRIDAYYLQRAFWFSRLQSPLCRTYLAFRKILRELRDVHSATV
jgi:peptidoglycan/xylan/chitin deacetylase (PgdA/CDA1 family)